MKSLQLFPVSRPEDLTRANGVRPVAPILSQLAGPGGALQGRYLRYPDHPPALAAVSVPHRAGFLHRNSRPQTSHLYMWVENRALFGMMKRCCFFMVLSQQHMRIMTKRLRR